jgi:hypothetical protein
VFTYKSHGYVVDGPGAASPNTSSMLTSPSLAEAKSGKSGIWLKSKVFMSQGMVVCCCSSDDSNEAGDGVPPWRPIGGTMSESMGAEPAMFKDDMMSDEVLPVRVRRRSEALGPPLPGSWVPGGSNTLGSGMEWSTELPVRLGVLMTSPKTSGIRSASRSSSIG